MLTFNKKNKKAVSIIIAYVLLIVITLTLSSLIYGWLRFYVLPGEEVKCPEGVSLIVKNYNYDCNIGKLNITLQNKGLFTVDGFIIRVSDRPDARIGIYVLENIGKKMPPGNISEPKEYSTGTIARDDLTFMEIQPFIWDDDNKVFCEKVATQTLMC